MQLSDNDIREFIEAWKKDFDETLTPDQARHEATKLLRLYALIARDMIASHRQGAASVDMNP